VETVCDREKIVLVAIMGEKLFRKEVGWRLSTPKTSKWDC
jgi:hypothetical protein